MLMNVVVKRQIPGTGLTEIFSFPQEVSDLCKTEEKLDWLFKIFRENNYEVEERDWNFPQNPKIKFSKRLPSQPPNTNWKDFWVITLKPCESQETMAQYIQSVLVK